MDDLCNARLGPVRGPNIKAYPLLVPSSSKDAETVLTSSSQSRTT